MNVTRVPKFCLTLVVALFFVASLGKAYAQDFDIFGDDSVQDVQATAESTTGSVGEEIPALNLPEKQLFDIAPVTNAEPVVAAKDTLASSEEDSVASRLNPLFCDQWVRVNERGVLLGSVVSIVGDDAEAVRGARVSLAQQGRVVAFMPTRKDGSFAFNGVKPGFYSVVVESSNYFATLGLAVLSQELGKHLPNDFEIRAISPKSVALMEILQRDIVPSMSSTNVDFALEDPIAKQRRFSTSRSIRTEKDGSIRGTISTMGMGSGGLSMVGMKASLLEDGNVIQTVPLSKEGSFRFTDLKTGAYGLFVAGPAGVAAVAFYAVNNSKIAILASANAGHLVAFVAQGEGGSGLNVELADGSDVTGSRQNQSEDSDQEETVPEEIVPTDPSIGTGTGGGGAPMSGGGGGSSGGGGGGGLAGLEGIAGLGLLAGGLAVAGNNNDNSFIDNQPPVVSPIVP